MKFTTGLILFILSIVTIYYLYRKAAKKSQFKGNNYVSPLCYWQLDDLHKTNVFAPWTEVLKSTLVDPSELNLPLDADNNYLVGDYKSKSIPQVKLYNLEDLIFVDWKSSAESWRHLAGSQGYIVISKSEKKQIDFIVSIMS